MSDEKNLTVPGAIVVAGLIIALAIISTNSKSVRNVTGQNDQNAPDTADTNKQKQAELANNVKPVSSDDHLLGKPNAPVKMIEFTDIECPFCKRIHPELEKIMDEYGKQGQVAWIIRHFPLSIHPKAFPAAIASECVYDQLGDIKFWEYITALFKEDLTNDDTDLAIFSNTALKIGVDLNKYNRCIATAGSKSKIQAQIDDGLAAGVSGTPYILVVAQNGKKFPINGALPYENIKAVIDLALGQK